MTQVLTNLQIYKSVSHPQRNFFFEKDISSTVITSFDLILCLVFQIREANNSSAINSEM